MTKKVLTVITIISIAFLLAFQGLHAAHESECHEENCPLCLVLQTIRSTLKGCRPAGSVCIPFIQLAWSLGMTSYAIKTIHRTLVSQKVKLVI